MTSPVPFVDAEVLAAHLVERLNRCVPSDVQVGVQGGQVTFGVAGQVREWLSFAEKFAAEEEWRVAADSAVWNVLDKLQDFVIEEAGIQPWPGPHGLARAEVRVTEDEIRFWYGDESNPTVAFEPITVGDGG
jgi:hypothetical protein